MRSVGKLLGVVVRCGAQCSRDQIEVGGELAENMGCEEALVVIRHLIGLAEATDPLGSEPVFAGEGEHVLAGRNRVGVEA